MSRSPLYLALVAGTLLFACTPRTEQRWVAMDVLEAQPESYEAASTRLPERQRCYDPLQYVPDSSYLSHTPKKYLRINFHWMNNADSTANLREGEARQFLDGLYMALNYSLENNKKMWLPHGNDTPVLPINFQYELTGRPGEPEDDGIYFHYDDELYHYVHLGRPDANLYDRKVFDTYGVRLDTVLNIFFLPHHPDSLRSPAYPGEDVGVALGNAVKFAADYKRAFRENKDAFWRFRGTINHEVGHIFGLSHSWAYNDGCDDTPNHPQRCWCREETRPGCDTLTSNNVMDYNCLQLAWSPCQIGKVQLRFADERRRGRNFLHPYWCEYDPEFDITITDTVTWAGMKDLEGNLTIAPGGHLTVLCRLSLPPEGRITVQAGGTLVLDGARLHQACGETWAGVLTESRGGREGRVINLGGVVVENVENRSRP